jgi:hypothetical protein
MADSKPAPNEKELQLIYEQTRQATSAAIHASIQDAEESFLNDSGKTKEVLGTMMQNLLPDNLPGKTPAQIAALRKNLVQIGTRWIEADPTLAANPDKLAQMYAQMVSNDPDDFQDIKPRLDAAAFKKVYNPDLGKKEDKGIFAGIWDFFKKLIFKIAQFFGEEGWVAGLAGIKIPSDKQVEAASEQVAAAVKEIFAKPENQTKTPEELQGIVSQHVHEKLDAYAKAHADKGDPIAFDEQQLQDMADKAGAAVRDQAATIHQVLTFREQAVSEVVADVKQFSADTARSTILGRTRFWIHDTDTTADIYPKMIKGKYAFNDQQLQLIGNVIVDATSDIIQNKDNQVLSQSDLANKIQQHLNDLLRAKEQQITDLGPPTVADVNYQNGTRHLIAAHENADILGTIIQHTGDKIRNSDPKDPTSAFAKIKDAQQKLNQQASAAFQTAMDRAMDVGNTAKQSGLTDSQTAVALIAAQRGNVTQIT